MVKNILIRQLFDDIGMDASISFYDNKRDKLVIYVNRESGIGSFMKVYHNTKFEDLRKDVYALLSEKEKREMKLKQLI